MKISLEHLEALRKHITPLDTPERRKQYRDGDFPNAERVKDLEMRYRWDLLWAVHPSIMRPLLRSMYDYMDDSHINTALRHIVPPLGKDAAIRRAA